MASPSEGDIAGESVANIDYFRSASITALGAAIIITLIIVAVHLLSRLCSHCASAYNQKISIRTADDYVGV